MTTAIYRGTATSLSVPQTQNTAPVLEFNCLYTHDIRRKKKRWQDGFLRFHTFNKRVMVYDVPRNFIGDTHWKEEGILQDGDEVTLEKDGVIVQVAESVGRTETDLTQLRKGKEANVRDRDKSTPLRKTPAAKQLPPSSILTTDASKLKHRSLNVLLGPCRGPIGKAAISNKSPFEQRLDYGAWEDGPLPKRRRMVQTPVKVIAQSTRSRQASSRDMTIPQSRRIDREHGSEEGESSDVELLGSRRKQLIRDQVMVLPPGPRQETTGQISRSRQSRRSPSADYAEHMSMRKSQTRTLGCPGLVRQSVVEAPLQTLRPAPKASSRKTLLCQDQFFAAGPPRLHASGVRGSLNRLGHDSPSEPEAQNSRIGKEIDVPKPSVQASVTRDNELEVPCFHHDAGRPWHCSPPAEPPLMLHRKYDTSTTSAAMELAKLDEMIMPPTSLQNPQSHVVSVEARYMRRSQSEIIDTSYTTSRPPDAPIHTVNGSHAIGPLGDQTVVTRSISPPRANVTRNVAKKPVQRALSLNTAMNDTSNVLLGRAFQAPKAVPATPAKAVHTPDPWSRDAFDLFTWRPPGWNEQRWCHGEVNTMET